MNMGLDFSEIAVILVLILIFFGSKEIPNIIRQAARFVGKVRMYSEKVKREINEISKIDEVMPTYDQEVAKKKEDLRARFIAKRKELSPEDRAAKSAVIWENLKRDPLFANAKAVMVYVEVGAEVAMRPAIAEMFASGKRVVLPYTNQDSTMGLAEVTDLEKDISLSGMGVYEPIYTKRNNFFRSDLQFIVCPAVAFDIYGGRLGRGRGCYDRFCKELKGRIHMYGVAFSCQILGPNERLPFSYHDIVMDQVITENGVLIQPVQAPSTPIEPPMQPAG
jgi:5-formyltetrahydrofolate cyclo-ligase